ncbi:MAG: hypothetical protein ACJ79R_20010 [Anaeromyxobacteraceae bacterium]
MSPHTRCAAAAVLALAACAPAPPPAPARMLSAAPTGAVAPDAVTVELVFDAPLDPEGLTDGRYFALGRRDDLRALSLAAEEPSGMAATAPVVPVRAELSADRLRVRLAPAAPLEPDGRWAAVLSTRARSAAGGVVLDPSGRARTFALLFDTGPAPDRTAPRPRWVVPPHGPAPSNLAVVQVAFDEEVSGALALEGVAAEPVALGADLLGLVLGSHLAPGPLAPSVVSVHDLAGNSAAPLPRIVVSACPSTAAPAAGVPRATPGELSVALDAPLAGMGRVGVEVSALAGDAACGVAPAAPAAATFRGDVLPCPGVDPCAPAAVTCPGRVVVRGLCPGQHVRAHIFTEDLAGHVATGEALEIAALPPRPAPVLTEALADADAPEAGGEYAEVANLGTGDADLAGFVVAKRGASGAFTRCTIAPAAGVAVAPGAHALVVGGAYDGRYPLPAGTPVYHCGATAFAGGLANDRAVALALEDPLGQVVSTLGIAEAAPRCATGSVERVDPAGADVASNWACPGTRTPGVCNHSTPPTACPKRPW